MRHRKTCFFRLVSPAFRHGEYVKVTKDRDSWKYVQFDNWIGDGELWNHKRGRVATKGTYKAELDVKKKSVNSLIQTDRGLLRKIPTGGLKEGAKTADEMNKLIVEGIKAEGFPTTYEKNLVNEDGNKNVSFSNVSYWLNKILKDDYISGTLK